MKKGMIMKTYIFAALTPTILLLGACATTPRPTSAEIDSCKAMEAEMGVQQTHDHNEIKQQGRNPMNLSHERCQQILRNAK